jgi:Ca-activated chloride channel family protein
MHFAHPGMLWGLPLLIGLGFFLAWRDTVRRAVLLRFAQMRMLSRLSNPPSAVTTQLRLLLFVLGLCSLLIALAGPQWGTRSVHVERRGIDVVFAVDLSASMDAQDYPPSRLDVARRELGDMMKALGQNRIGLVGFAGQAFMFCPLTLDVDAAHLFLDEMSTSALPVPGTSIGDAIRTSMAAFPTDGAKGSKVIVLLSDGEDHHSDPEGAAKEAAAQGIVIDTVGIGSAKGDPIPQKDDSGKVIGYLKDAQGNTVVSKLGEETLKQIASETGGSYTHVEPNATNPLAPVIESIDKADKRELEENLQGRWIERFSWFVGAGLCFLIAERLLALQRPRAPRTGVTP